MPRALAAWLVLLPGGAAPAAELPAAASVSERIEKLAATAPRGSYPRYFAREQSYFTVIGTDGGGRSGLINTDGAIEVDRGAFSIEPFLYADGELATWHEARAEPALERGYLPLPAVAWRWRGLQLTAAGFATDPGGAALRARYRLENTRRTPVKARLFLAIRPFQVNPSWQSLNMTGGIAPIARIRREGALIRVDGRAVIPSAPPAHFGALAFAAGNPVEGLRQGRVAGAASVHDPEGLASAVLEYDLNLPPRGRREIFLGIPFGDPDAWLAGQPAGPLKPRDETALRHVEAAARWERRLNRAELILPPARAKLWDGVRSNLAYILVQRDGPAFRPGSRTYARTWIRDSALIGSALLGLGYNEEVRDFLRWFARFQYPDGKIPCCVDGRGADPTPENDSHGEFVFLLAEYWRYTGDAGLVRELWPAAARAVAYMDGQRKLRQSAEYETPEKRAFYGLMPESISHEGYSARPVHSFWDDFWTLRGLRDAAELATLIRDDPARYARIRDEFRRDLHAAVAATMARHRIGYFPASVELGDFDVTSTSMAVNLGEAPGLPAAALARTYDDYRAHVLKRRDGRIDWDAYTPYEVRNVEALVRLGRRDEALELLDFLLAGQRPAAWNHWAEVVWRDARAPKFIGDMPHAWIGAEFARAVRALYAYEEGETLVLAAGLPADWLETPGGVGVRRLPTPYGPLGYRIRRSGPDEIRVRLDGGLKVPPGRILLRPPGGRSIRSLTVDGRRSADFTAREARVGSVPAEVVLKLGK